MEIIDCISGEEAINRIENNEKFHLLLVDDMMPGMSGTKMMQKLRKDGYSVPMIVLTANVMSGQKEKYVSLGFDDYLGKPINRHELDRVLNTYLKKDLEKTVEFEPLPKEFYEID